MQLYQKIKNYIVEDKSIISWCWIEKSVKCKKYNSLREWTTFNKRYFINNAVNNYYLFLFVVYNLDDRSRRDLY